VIEIGHLAPTAIAATLSLPIYCSRQDAPLHIAIRIKRRAGLMKAPETRYIYVPGKDPGPYLHGCTESPQGIWRRAGMDVRG